MAYNNGPRIVTDGLVVYLDAANRMSYPGSGAAWNDVSNNGRTVTIVSGSTFSSQSLGAVRFDGINDHMLLPAPSPMGGTQTFTAELWVNFDRISGVFGGIKNAVFLFAGGSGTGANQPEWVVTSNNTSTFTPATMSFDNGAGNTVGDCTVVVAGSINTGSWYQLVLTRPTSNSQRMYINGLEVGTGSVSNTFVNGITAFGGLPVNSEFSAYLSGSVGKLLLYTRALSAQEVLQNYNATRGRFGV